MFCARRISIYATLVTRLLLNVCLVSMAAAGYSVAAESGDDFERNIIAELKTQNPAAVTVFNKANAARSKGDHRLAAELYRQVYESAPRFVHALRRQCGEIIRLHDRAAALPLCREAVRKEASPENLATLSYAILSVGSDQTLSHMEGTEALELAVKAVDLKPDDQIANIILCNAAMVVGSPPALRRGIHMLERVAPNFPDLQNFKIVLAVMEGRYEDAEWILEKNRALGMSDSQYQSNRALIHGARPIGYRWFGKLVLWGVTWLGGFLILLFVGWLLSQLALRAAARIPTSPRAAVGGIDAALRRIYRAVLWLCCVYYYVSLPLVSLVVMGLGAGVLYTLLAIGHIPVNFVLIVLLLVFGTIWAIIKSVFVRVRDADPGDRLKLEDHPSLAKLIVEVADALHTRPVHSIYMTPGTDIAVMERGGMLRQLTGRKERCLILGVGILEGMSLGPFRAILAHEYGHLSNQDTAGGGFALAVRRSLGTMAENLAARGAAGWYNPAWLFLNGFYSIFLRISQGASRLQEVLADRWAALNYGGRAFEEGLRHAITQSIRFEAHARATLDEIMNAHAALHNLYQYRPMTTALSRKHLQADIDDALNRPASAYDSHPSPQDRFSYIRALPIDGEISMADYATEVWSLFTNRKSIELEMTDVIRMTVREQTGVEIPAGTNSKPTDAVQDVVL